MWRTAKIIGRVQVTTYRIERRDDEIRREVKTLNLVRGWSREGGNQKARAKTLRNETIT